MEFNLQSVRIKGKFKSYSLWVTQYILQYIVLYLFFLSKHIIMSKYNLLHVNTITEIIL